MTVTETEIKEEIEQATNLIAVHQDRTRITTKKRSKETGTEMIQEDMMKDVTIKDKTTEGTIGETTEVDVADQEIKAKKEEGLP